MRITLLAVLSLLALPAAQAEPRVSRDEGRQASVTTWLDMQRAGSQASSVPQTLTPVIQERVVKRYLDSFNAPIPVFFTDSGTQNRVGGR